MSSTSNSNLSKSPGKSNVWPVPQDKLKILIRIRPVLNEQQQNQFVQLQDHNTLQIKRPGNFTYMKFNHILPYYSTQKDVFNLLEQSVNQFLAGTNTTIFAYGQTGAGKTYSIIGNYSSSPNTSSSQMSENDSQNIYHLLSSEERGILSRSLEMIMEAVQNREGGKVFISFYQIYNQKIFDLYNKQGSGALEIRQSKAGEISIPNLISIQINRIEEAIHYLMIGLKSRSTGSTHANAKSSRSHSIFQISFENQGKTSSLRIVDLAGSQKFKIPSDITAHQKQVRIQELTSINGSLSCLGHCISALIQKARTHVPFRNSKLTRILSDSLLGQGKMRFIICISPSVSASAQTFSTLQFANRAKRAIFDRSQMRTPSQLSKKKSQNQQMLVLRKQLQKQRQLRTAHEQQLGEFRRQNTFLKIQNQKLQGRIRDISSKAGQMSKSILDQKRTNNHSKSHINEHSNNFQTDQKQNDLHLEMLNLPIFQKNRGSIQNLSPSSCSVSRNKPINVKKAEFQKKIRKFIEQNSPQLKQKTAGLICQADRNPKASGQAKVSGQSRISDQSRILLQVTDYQNKNRSGSNRNEAVYNQGLEKIKDIIKTQNSRRQEVSEPQQLPIDFRRQQVSTDLRNEQQPIDYRKQQPIDYRKQQPIDYRKQQLPSFINQQQPKLPNNTNAYEQNEEQLDSLWQYHQEQTQQFFQRACQKMNMRQYQDLREQMERAKSQLIRFKNRDSQIQNKKT